MSYKEYIMNIMNFSLHFLLHSVFVYFILSFAAFFQKAFSACKINWNYFHLKSFLLWKIKNYQVILEYIEKVQQVHKRTGEPFYTSSKFRFFESMTRAKRARALRFWHAFLQRLLIILYQLLLFEEVLLLFLIQWKSHQSLLWMVHCNSKEVDFGRHKASDGCYWAI